MVLSLTVRELRGQIRRLTDPGDATAIDRDRAVFDQAVWAFRRHLGQPRVRQQHRINIAYVAGFNYMSAHKMAVKQESHDQDMR